MKTDPARRAAAFSKRLQAIIEPINKGESCTRVSVRMTKADADRQLVYGEVYAPYVIDTQRDMMLPDDIEYMAHDFMANCRNNKIDVMHDNRLIEASVVESFIARNHPDFAESSWAMVTHIDDEHVWEAIKQGKFNGYSMEVYAFRCPAIVELDVQPHFFGTTEVNNGHDHAFYVMLDDFGKVTGGTTSVDFGHSHAIKRGTATEFSADHTHRFFIS